MQFYEPKAFRTQHKSNRQASNTEELVDPYVLKEEYSGEIVDYVPYKASDLVATHNAQSLTLFNSLIEAGVCREQARGVLPQNLYTQYIGTVNLNNLLKFIELRSHEGAQWEIQQVAKACYTIAKELWPVTVGAHSLECIAVKNENGL